MSVGFIRPRVADLSLAIFERTLHPELFVVRRSGLIRQPGYTAAIGVCDSGHIVTFRTTRGPLLTEVFGHKGQLLPERLLVLERKIKGSRDDSIRSDGINCQVSFQVEQLEPIQFLNLHQELLVDCERAPISHSFQTANRLTPAPLSFIQTDVWSHSLLIHSFHTFPDDCAIIKTQTLFEL